MMSVSDINPNISTAQAEKLMPSIWTSTQPDPRAYTVRARNLTPANVPGQRVTGELRDGRHVVEASVPHCYYELWIDPAGNVRSIPLKTARTTENGAFVDNGSYIHEMKHELWSKGFLSYLDGERGEDKQAWLARRAKVIAERRQSQTDDMQEADKRHMDGKRAKHAEMQEALLALFNGFNERMGKKGK